MLFGIGLDNEQLPDSGTKSNKIDPPIAQPNAVFFGEDSHWTSSKQNWRYQPDGTEEKLQKWAINVTMKEKRHSQSRRYGRINQLIDSQQSDFSFDDL